MKKPTRKTLVRKLDELWAVIIKQRAGYKCEICGLRNCQLNSHHINGRSPQTLRWDTDNGICLCTACHTFGSTSAHSVSYEGQKKFHEKLELLRGKKLLEELAIKKGQPVVIYKDAALIEHYKTLEGELLDNPKQNGL